jgi:hypothetical protein
MTRRLTGLAAALLALGALAAVEACHKGGGSDQGGSGSGATVCTTPCNQIIAIGSDGALSCADATIQLGVNEVAWRSASATARLQITFDAPSPFPNLRCENSICVSGPTDPNVLPPGTNSKSFAYSATSQEPEGGETAASAGGGQPAAPLAVTPTRTPVRATQGHIIIQR